MVVTLLYFSKSTVATITTLTYLPQGEETARCYLVMARNLSRRRKVYELRYVHDNIGVRNGKRNENYAYFLALGL